MSSQDLSKNLEKCSSADEEHGSKSKKLPDGGWAWMVVFGSFMCNVVLDGIAFSYGILLKPLLESFDSSRSIMSNGGSLMFGFYLLSSPISGVLINKIGSRTVCIIGCIIGALGIGLSSFSPNVAVFLITYGVIGGYGLGTMYLPSMVVISDYSDKKRGLATGIADSGSGVGILVFAPLTTMLLEAYGWKGTHLAFGFLCLASILFATLMGPLTSRCQKKIKEENMKDQRNFSDELLLEPKKSFWKTLTTILNFSILKNPMFLLVGITNLIACFGLFVPYFYLPDLVVEKNFTKEESSYLISAMGITNTFGRIGVCWISDIAWMNSLWSCVAALLFTGMYVICSIPTHD
jgi:MFS family permease